MTERVRLRPTLGCAPVPVSTGRLPGLVNPSRPNASLHQLWLPPSSDLPVPQRRYSFDRYDASRVTGICDLRRTVISQAKHIDDDVFLTRTVLQARPQTTEPSFNLEEPQTRASNSSDGERPSSLSRYTPLPAIGGRLGSSDSDGDNGRRSEASLVAEDLWLPSSGPTSPFHEHSSVKLPPLRPVVRSRTFTILTDAEDDCWVDGDRIVRPDSDAVRTPPGEEEDEEDEVENGMIPRDEDCEVDPVLTLRCDRFNLR